ncbi:MAG TPA: PAS domain S-box protein, partial [Thermoanaerobaculia bacterium]
MFVVILLLAAASYATRRGGTVEELAEMVFDACVAIGAVSLLTRSHIARAQKSERKLAALLDSVDDATFVLDQTGRYVEVWGPRDRLLAAGEVLRGKHVSDYINPEVTKFILTTIRQALSDQKRRTVDYELEIEGRATWWNAMVTPLDSKHVLWVGRDITARKNAENALHAANIELNDELAGAINKLRTSEERYRGIVEQAREVIFTLDTAGCFTSLNPAFETILGWRCEEWLGREFRELLRRLLGADPSSRLQSFEQTLREESDGEWELHVVDAYGHQKILNCVARVVRNAEDRAIRIIGTAQDVTERRRDEQRLRENEERFRLMGRATSDAMWDWHLETDVCWWGDGLQARFGYQPAQSTDVDFWRTHIHPEDKERVLGSIQSARASRALSWSEEYRFRCADGRYAYVLDRAYVARDDNGVAERMVGAMIDLSERRKMQEQLAEATRLSSLGRIATSIAHEFNNVLMGMQANLEVVRRRAPV